MRMRLAWLVNSRPDFLFEIAQLEQITEQMFDSDTPQLLRKMNKAIKYAADNRVCLKLPNLYVNTLRIVGFSHSSSDNN